MEEEALSFVEVRCYPIDIGKTSDVEFHPQRDFDAGVGKCEIFEKKSRSV